MNLGAITFSPALIALAALLLGYSVETAFVFIYLPALLLLPNYFHWGLPALSFPEWALIPIWIVLLRKIFHRQWHFSALDGLVFAFVTWNFLSDSHSMGITAIVDRIAAPFVLAIVPYLAAKMLIEPTGRRVTFMRMFIYCLFIDSVLAVYEFRMGDNPVRNLFQQLFSTNVGWFTQMRGGFGRASGPFGHSIMMGSALAIAIILQRYLMRYASWKRGFRWLPNLPVSKSWILLLGLIAGSLMTLSRGPWMGVVAGLMIAAVGTSANPIRALIRVVPMLVLGGLLLVVSARTFLNAEDIYSSQDEIATAAYRVQLLDLYREIALEKSFWGWGTSMWPTVRGMQSIDNEYLLLTLNNGLPALILFGLLVSVAVVRLSFRALFARNLPSSERALLFTISGALVAVAVSAVTVSLGEQLYPIVFLLFGWGEGCLVSNRRCSVDLARNLERQVPFRFRSVLT